MSGDHNQHQKPTSKDSLQVEAMKKSLDALKAVDKGIIPGGIGSDERSLIKQAITALRKAIEQTEKQEPVAWYNPDESTLAFKKLRGDWHPLYTAPPQREWVELTIHDIFCLKDSGDFLELVEIIEDKIKEKNHAN